MADVISVERRVIPTSAGDFVFLVHTLDVAVEVGVQITFNTLPLRYPQPVSIPASGGVVTECDGPLEIVRDNASMYARLYQDGQVKYTHSSGIPSSSNYVLVCPGVLLGSNGVAHATNLLTFLTVKSTSGWSFTSNTDSNFGALTAPTYFSQNYTPTESNISLGNLLIEISEPYDPNNDPYANGGTTDSGGGTGDFDGSSDAIDIPDLPSASATDAGFITLFNPTLSQMQSLASYMWSDLFDLDAWRKIFADPMDAILGLSIVPVKVASSGTREVKVGNISTGVTMDVAASQYVKVDCGTLNVKEYWGAYLDYEPFTKAEIYLPYIGTHPIAVDDIMGKSVHVVYHVDILSGACVAYVKCSDGKLDSVLYNFVGQCSSSIPITGNDWTNVVNGVLSIAGSIGTMVATGGAAAPFAVGEIASSAVNSMKPSVEKSGSVSGTGGLMGIQKPYLILTRPRQAVPKNQYKYTGYPAYINRKLSDLEGYTEVDQIHIEGVYATEQEYSELDSLIRSGVIF